MGHALPDALRPMLAASGRPFDSPEHLFEIKWDGIRALTFVDPEGVRLRGRRGTELGPRYPELACLGQLPPGTLLDGEIVVLRDGRPDFSSALTREQARGTRRIAAAARDLPVTYVVFDLLYHDFRPLLERPLEHRRQRLGELLREPPDPRLVLSEGLVGSGLDVFERVAGQGFEGILAKRLDSPYLPGKRSDAWTKIKPVQSLYCAILGFIPDGARDVKSLVIATEDEGVLCCVGRVGSGLTQALRTRLRELVASRLRDEPLIPCDIEARWIEPGLYCTVSFVERTQAGMLRAPVFRDLIVE